MSGAAGVPGRAALGQPGAAAQGPVGAPQYARRQSLLTLLARPSQPVPPARVCWPRQRPDAAKARCGREQPGRACFAAALACLAPFALAHPPPASRLRPPPRPGPQQPPWSAPLLGPDRARPAHQDHWPPRQDCGHCRQEEVSSRSSFLPGGGRAALGCRAATAPAQRQARRDTFLVQSARRAAGLGGEASSSPPRRRAGVV